MGEIQLIETTFDITDILLDIFIEKIVTEKDCEVLAERIRAVAGVSKLDLGFRTTVSFNWRANIAAKEVVTVINDWGAALSATSR